MMEPNAQPYTLEEPPHAVGAYWIGGVNSGLGFAMTYRPIWLHRMMMRWAFGWVWRDVNPRPNRMHD